MTEFELRKLLRQGESENLEFKESFDRDVAETIGAFANTRGGAVLIGVSDHGNVKGLQVGAGTLNEWVNQISQVTEPKVIPDAEVVEIGGRKVVVLQLEEFPIKPVSVRGRCYRRIGTANRVMTPHEIAQMHLVASGSTWDTLPAADATIKDLDFARVRRYVRSANATGRRNIDSREPPLTSLTKLELVKRNHPTWAAVLLFGKAPQEKLGQAAFHCGRFKAEVMIIDDKMVRGTLVDQVDEVMAFIRKNTNVRIVVTGKPAHDEIWDYPLDALREAVMNAVIHRDYADASDIQIKIYEDWLQIWNPGGLLPGITIEDLYNPRHLSKLRNRLIAQTFYDLELIEKYGSGIQRIIRLCEDAGLPAPMFEEKFGGFMVTFRKDIYSEEHLRTLGLNERQIRAAERLREAGRIANREYQELNAVSKRTASTDLNDLVRRGIVERVGSTGRGTDYVLKGATKGQKGQQRGKEGAREASAAPSPIPPQTRQRRHKPAKNLTYTP